MVIAKIGEIKEIEVWIKLVGTLLISGDRGDGNMKENKWQHYTNMQINKWSENMHPKLTVYLTLSIVCWEEVRKSWDKLELLYIIRRGL